MRAGPIRRCYYWEETGYGISCRMQDNEHPILVVDIPGQRVFVIQEDQLTERAGRCRGVSRRAIWCGALRIT